MRSAILPLLLIAFGVAMTDSVANADDGGHSVQAIRQALQSPIPNTSENDVVQQLLATDDARRAAMLRGDMNALSLLLADDAVIIWGDGTVDDKGSALAILRSGSLRYTRLEYSKTAARVYGDVGVVTGDARVQGQSNGHRLDQFGHVSRVYVRQQDRWCLVLSQTTRAPRGTRY
jgi:hypothetical protein